MIAWQGGDTPGMPTFPENWNRPSGEFSMTEPALGPKPA
jgi:hypothetical protein